MLAVPFSILIALALVAGPRMIVNRSVSAIAFASALAMTMSCALLALLDHRSHDLVKASPDWGRGSVPRFLRVDD